MIALQQPDVVDDEAVFSLSCALAKMTCDELQDFTGFATQKNV